MKVKIKLLSPTAKVPTYGTGGAACFDLYADMPEGGVVYVTETCPVLFKTNIAVEVPEGHVMLVYSRSGHGFKHGARLANCVGVIDSDYRGEVGVKLTSDGSLHESLVVKHHDRIAQAMIVPVQQVEFEQVEDLSDTVRGAGGFGSTGA